jgi:hypothetical protein
MTATFHSGNRHEMRLGRPAYASYNCLVRISEIRCGPASRRKCHSDRRLVQAPVSEREGIGRTKRFDGPRTVFRNAVCPMQIYKIRLGRPLT